MRNISIVFLIHTLALLCARCAFALPAGLNVEMGKAEAVRSGSDTMVITASNKSIINFDSFQIENNEKVNIVLPNDTATVLIRIADKKPVFISGILKANGIVFFISPAGVSLSKQGSLRANSFFVSSLGLSTHNFINSYYEFIRDEYSRAHISNEGVIDAFQFACVSSSMGNLGIIQVRGHLDIACADSVMLKVGHSGELQTEVLTRATTHSIDMSGKSIDDAIANDGTISAQDLRFDAQTAAGIFMNGISLRGTMTARGTNQEIRDQISIYSNRRIDVSGKINLMKCDPSFANKIVSDESITVSQALKIRGNSQFCAQKDIFVKDSIVSECGSLALEADSSSAGQGAIQQAASADLTTLSKGNIILRSSGESRIGKISSSGSLVLEKSGSQVTYLQWPDTRITTSGPLAIRKGVKLNSRVGR